MHETAIAHSLFNAVSDEAKKHNAKLLRAKISCGSLNAVNDEILSFAFEAVAKDTICEGVELEIEHKPIQAKCSNCNCVFDIDFKSPQCPRCSSNGFELIPDAPLLLESVEFL
jgi:hydrogenase nickel incorporation protein HypA/HybF